MKEGWKLQQDNDPVSGYAKGELPALPAGKPATAEAAARQPDSDEASVREKYLRLCADFENHRKRTAAEMQNVIRSANEELIGELLPFIDNLERAVKYASSVKKEAFWVVAGVRLTIKDLLHTLSKRGLQPIEAVGRPFDPNLHEAVSVVRGSGHPPNTVVEELRKGYLFNNGLLRASRVVVAMAPDSADDEPQPA